MASKLSRLEHSDMVLGPFENLTNLVPDLLLEALDKDNNQPVTGATKAGDGWQASINKATTGPGQWAMTNDKSMWWMMMAVTKRARVARTMVMAMRAAGDDEGEGDKEDTGVGNKGGMQQRGRWQQLQE